MATVNEIMSQSIADIIEYYKPVGGKIDQMNADISALKNKVAWVDVTEAPYNAKGDGVTDDTAAFENALAYLESKGGGVLKVPVGAFILTYLKLRSYVVIQGDGEKSILKLKNGTNSDFVTLKDNSIIKFQLRNLAIDGNKANNTVGNGILIQKTDFVPTSAFDIVSLISDLNISNCAGHGLAILDYTKADSAWINIRALDLINVLVHDCVGTGIYAVGWTDSRVKGSGGFLNDYGMNLKNTANIHFTDCKTFYNRKTGMYLENSKRSTFVQCEAQEESWHGWHLNNCSHIDFSATIADANNRENNYAGSYAGYYLQNCSYIDIVGVSTSYPPNPKWQAYSITLDGCSWVRGVLTATSILNGNAPRFLNTNQFCVVVINGNQYGNIQTSDGSWQGGHLILGVWRVWLDNHGRLRIKYGAPTADTDGAITALSLSGTTANRPTGVQLYVGMFYYDTTLGKPIWWNGSAWRDATNTTV